MGHLSSAQIRGARAMLGWSMIDLSRAARLSIASIQRAEDDAGVSPSDRLKEVLRSVLETAGVVFLQDDGQGCGMRLDLRKGRVRPMGDAAGASRITGPH